MGRTAPEKHADEDPRRRLYRHQRRDPIDGKSQTIRGPKDALAADHVDLPDAAGAEPDRRENIFLGSELARGGLVQQRKAMLSQAQAVIDRLGAQFKASATG